MNLVLFGPPGAGKGTQSQFLIDTYNLVHVSTGDLLRVAVKEKTSLGLEAKKFMDAGDLVPDAVVIGLIKEVMKKEKGRGLLLDGFPRNVAQAEALDRLLDGEKVQVDRAAFLEVDPQLLKARLVGRRVCSKCGTVYNVEMKKPRLSGFCDLDGGILEHRKDQAEVIENRLEVYEKNTAPLKAYYKKANKFVAVSGVGEPLEVFGRLTEALGEPQ